MRKLIAVIFIILFTFPLLFASLTTLSVSTWVLDRSFYQGLLEDTRLYEIALSDTGSTSFGNFLVREMNLPREVLPALKIVITPDYLRSQTNQMLDQVFSFIEGQSTSMDFYLDIAPLKTSLTGEKLTQFAAELANILPKCPEGQTPSLGDSLIPTCISPNLSQPEATKLIEKALPLYLNRLPDHLQLSRRDISFDRDWRNNWFRGFPMSAGLFLSVNILVVIVISVVILLIGSLIGGKNWKGRLQWLGWSLIIPAALLFLTGLVAQSSFTTGWIRYGLSQAHFGMIFEDVETFRQALVGVSLAALVPVTRGFLMVGGAAGGLALALLIWGWSLRSPRPVVPAMPPAVAAVQPPAPQPVIAPAPAVDAVVTDNLPPAEPPANSGPVHPESSDEVKPPEG